MKGPPMLRAELPRVIDRLTELADAMPRGRAPTAGAASVWFDTLAECRLDDILYVLTDWPKTHHIGMPAPADILALCRKRVSDRLEVESKRNAKQSGFDAAQLRPGPSCDPHIAASELAKIKSILKTPKPGPKQWAHRLRKREEAGEPLSDLQKSSLRAALRFYAPSAEDYEAAQERLAIKAEA